MSTLGRSVGQWLKWLRGIDQTADVSPAETHVAPVADKPPVSVFETGYPLEAEVVRGLLECHDIPAMVQRVSVSQVYPFTIGDLATCRILVPVALEMNARLLIAETYGDSSNEAEEEGTGAEGPDSRRENNGSAI